MAKHKAPCPQVIPPESRRNGSYVSASESGASYNEIHQQPPAQPLRLRGQAVVSDFQIRDAVTTNTSSPLSAGGPAARGRLGLFLCSPFANGLASLAQLGLSLGDLSVNDRSAVPGQASETLYLAPLH